MKEKNYSFLAFIKKTIPLFLMMLFVNVGWGQTDVIIGGGASVACPAVPTATYTPSVTGVTFSNWSRGSGVTCASAGSGIAGSGFNTADASASFTANKYFAITVTAGATYNVTLSSVTWAYQTSSGTAKYTLSYKNNGGTLTDFGSAITSTGTTGTAVYTGSVVIAAGTSLVLYMIPSNTTAVGTTTRLNNASKITVNAVLSGCSAPTTASSAYAFSNVAQTTMDVAFTSGNGAGRVVLMNTSNTFTAPVTGVNPTANTVYASGQQVVYNGTGNSFSVSGLDPSTAYYYSIYEYCSPDRTYGSGFAGNQTTIASANPLLSISGTLAHGSSCLNVAATSVEYTITNTGLSTATGISVSSSNPEFVVSGLSSTSITASGTATYQVTFTPTTAEPKMATITVTSNATPVGNTLTGTGLNTSVSVTTGTTYATSSNSASIYGSLIQGCSGIVDYGIEYSTTINFDSGTGTPVASSNLNAGNFTVNLSGLESGTTYYYKAFATDDNGTVRGTQSSFMTDAIANPTATAATAVTQTSFTANWGAVSGATGYELDVYKIVGSITQVINETFTWTANSTGGNDDLWSGSVASGTIVAGDLVGWTLTSANKANYCIKAGSSSNLGIVTTPELNFSGSGVLTFRAGAWNGGSEQTTLKLEISGGGTLNISQVTMVKGAFTNFSVNISDATALTKITFKGFANSNSRFFLDDVKIMVGTTVITPADGYPDLAVVGTSKVVTGLTSNTQYFYKVRAKDATSTSISSDEIAVKTKPTSVTWNGTAWSNTSGPDATIDAIIDGNFNQATDLAAKSLTINSGKVFTVATGNTLTVVNAITNNAGVTGLVIESDAVVLQTSTAANTALATVKRNSASLYRQDYTLWSSPVGGQNLRSFSPLTLFNRFYSYNTADNVYSQEIVTSQDSNDKTFNMGQGYLIRMPNIDDAQNPVAGYAAGTTAKMNMGSFKGTLTNGNVSIPLSLAGSKFNLVGNPYASPINISTFLTANASQIEGTLYFWRKTNSNTYPTGTGYVTYSLGGIVSIDPSLSGQTTLSSINTGQGFMVSAKSGATAVAFSNTMRESASTLFFKSASENTNELHRFWLNLSNETNVVGQTLVAYATDATQDLDANFDAPYINDSPVALTSIINNTELIIQGRSLPFLNTDFVPLGFKTDVAGSYTIALSNFDGLFAESQDIFLKDKSTNTLHNLKTAAYAFTSPVGVFNDRFEVQYNSVLGTTNPTFDANTILIAVKNQQININAGSVTMEKIELIDVSGRVLFTVKDVNATTATIENLKASNQMLIVRISTKENGLVSKKIIF